MLADRFGLPLSTSSVAARDAYVDASERALTFYPGALAAYNDALAADPDFALAHAGKAQVLMREGNVADARAALLVAKKLAVELTEREASHVAIFDLGLTGQTESAIAAVHNHLTAWPLDALVISIAANPNGLIGGSGRLGQKHQIAELMDSVAPRYGDDYWFLSYHAMALSEDGRLAEARPKIERSVALNPKNAHGAHGFAHVCYESGEPDTARAFLLPWLAEYPRDGFFYGHLSWHLSLVEIALGHEAEARALYRDAIELGRHSGGPQQKMSDGCAFLWRSELAGHPRDADAWRVMYDYAREALPRPGSGLADLHVILAHAVIGDDAAQEMRSRQIEELAAAGRYPSGSYLPGLAGGFTAFERGDFAATINAFAPLAGQNERIGGSRAQHDLIEFTLLKAYLESWRLEEAKRLLSARRPGASGIPVAGIEAIQ
jgi:tetratricopeptide (TPR) repeat protein